MSKILVSRNSIKNLIRELRGLSTVVMSKDDIDEKDACLDEGIEEIIYNILLLPEGIEYVSDEYSYLSSRVKECE